MHFADNLARAGLKTVLCSHCLRKLNPGGLFFWVILTGRW